MITLDAEHEPGVITLCSKCQQEASKRFDAAERANPGWDVEQWTTWWDRELKRQIAKINSHCYGFLDGTGNTYKLDDYFRLTRPAGSS